MTHGHHTAACTTLRIYLFITIIKIVLVQIAYLYNITPNLYKNVKQLPIIWKVPLANVAAEC